MQHCINDNCYTHMTENGLYVPHSVCLGKSLLISYSWVSGQVFPCIDNDNGMNDDTYFQKSFLFSDRVSDLVCH